MLIALITYFLLMSGGGAGIDGVFSSVTDEQVEAAVANEASRATIMEARDALRAELSEAASDLEVRAENLRQLHLDPDALPIDFDASEAHFRRLMLERQRTTLHARATMRNALTKAEWDALFAVD